MAGTQAASIIGRVGIRVHPETGGFRRQAKRELETIQRELGDLEVGLQLDPRRVRSEAREAVREAERTVGNIHTKLEVDEGTEGLSRLEKRLKEMEHYLRVKVQLDKEEAQRQIEHLRDKYDGDDIEFDVQVHALKARSEIARVARRRQVNLVLNVTKRSIAKAQAAIAALAGGRFVEATWRRITDLFRNMDKNIPLIGSIALAIQGLSAWLAAASSNAFALSRSLAQMAGAGLALPGIAGGMAIATGALISSLLEFNDVLPEVAERLSSMRDIMTEDFWRFAKGPTQETIDKLFGPFQYGMRETSTALGIWFGELAEQIGKHLGGSLPTMFNNLNASVMIATGGLEEAANIVEILGRRGSQYLPRLASWFKEITTNFSEWLTAKDASGELDEFINIGIDRMKEFGRVIAETGGILSGLARAADRAGGSTLASLAEKLASIHDAIDAPDFQNRLTEALLAAHDAMDRIARVSGPRVSAFFKNLVDLLSQSLPDVGDSIGELIGGITETLSTPRFNEGFTSFFDSLRKALEGLSGMWEPLGAGLGAILSLAGTFAENFAPLLEVMVVTLSRIVDRVGPGLERISEAMSGRLLGVLEAMAPVAERLAGAFVALVEPLLRVPGLVEAAALAFAAWKFATFAGHVQSLTTIHLATLISSLGSLRRAARNASAAIGRFFTRVGRGGLGGLGLIAGLTALVGLIKGIAGLQFPEEAAASVDEFALSLEYTQGVLDGTVTSLEECLDPMARLNEAFQMDVGNGWLPGMGGEIRGIADAIHYASMSGFGEWAYGVGSSLGMIGDYVGESRDAIENFDQSLAEAVRAGNLEAAAAQADEFRRSALLQGKTTEWVDQQLDAYNVALERNALVQAAAEAEALRTSHALAEYSRVVRDLNGISPALVGAINEGSKAMFNFAQDIDNTDMSAREWISSLEDQVSAQGEWADNMAILAQKGVSEGVLAELAKLPQGAERVEQLTHLSEDELEHLNQVFEDGMKGAVASSSGAFADLARDAVSEMSGLDESTRAALEDMPDVFWSMGWDAVQAYIDGVESGDEGEENPTARQIGINIGVGIINGMKERQREAEKRAEDLADGIVRAHSDRLQIASPSKVFAQHGRWIVEGLVEGIKSLLPFATAAGSTLGQSVLSGLGTVAGYAAGRLLGLDIRTGLYSFDNVAQGKIVGNRIVKGVKGTSGYSAGRDLARSLRQGLYSYPNAGTGAYVGRRVRVGVDAVSLYSTGRNLARDLRRGMYSYPNAGTGAYVARRAKAGMDGVSAYSAGRSLGSSFAKGILSTELRVKKAVGTLMSAAKRLIPQSPAKEGPFSGSGWVDNSGMSIGDAFAEGILARVPKVRMAALAMVDAAAEVNKFNMNGLDAAISTDNQHTVSLANTPVTFVVDGRPMQAYIQEGVNNGLHGEGRALKYAKANTWRP